MGALGPVFLLCCIPSLNSTTPESTPFVKYNDKNAQETHGTRDVHPLDITTIELEEGEKSGR
jgi:hypothetical protein